MLVAADINVCRASKAPILVRRRHVDARRHARGRHSRYLERDQQGKYQKSSSRPHTMSIIHGMGQHKLRIPRRAVIKSPSAVLQFSEKTDSIFSERESTYIDVAETEALTKNISQSMAAHVKRLWQLGGHVAVDFCHFARLNRRRLVIFY